MNYSIPLLLALGVTPAIADGKCVPKHAAAPPPAEAAPATPAPPARSWAAEKPDAKHVDELRASQPESFRTNRAPPGTSERYGHAETIVHAPAAVVLGHAKDYAHYRELAPRRFKAASVLDKTPTYTDIYLEVPMVGGLVVLWQVLRFAPVADMGQAIKRVEGVLVKGNVQNTHVVFDIIPLGPKETLIQGDLLIALPFAAPQDKIDEELRDAMADALRGIRKASEASAAAPANPPKS